MRTILLISCLVVLLVFGQAGCDASDNEQPHLPDKELIANFNAHKADFEKLVSMVLEDKDLTRVDDDWTSPRDPQTIGVSPERIAEYRQMFAKLGLPRGFSATVDKTRIEFIASSQGYVTHGSSKGYLYGDKSFSGEVVESLDEMSLAKRPFGSGCRHIEGKWYLYFNGD